MPSNNNSLGYAGDASVEQAWEALESVDDAILVDVRTRAEWAFVGIPDLSAVSKEPILVEWVSFPAMSANERFDSDLKAALEQRQLGSQSQIYFLCRSGARSRAAAIRSAQLGYPNSFNIEGGFEGDLDGQRHRNSVNGWRRAGLPWIQN